MFSSSCCLAAAANLFSCWGRYWGVHVEDEEDVVVLVAVGYSHYEPAEDPLVATDADHLEFVAALHCLVDVVLRTGAFEDVMTRKVETATPETSVMDGFETMQA
jgi:CBS domain-containing protein